MSSYLNALKRSLFRSSVEEPREPAAPVDPTTLSEKWIYIHDESSSTCDDEVINLNDTTFNSDSLISQDKALEMAEEIRKTRELWLKKQHKLLAGQRAVGASKGVRSHKLKSQGKSRRSRNSPSASSDQSEPLNPNANAAALQNPGSSEEAPQSGSDEKACGQDLRSLKSVGKVRSKRAKLQSKFRPYSVSVRAKTLNQPAAKGMC